MDVHIVIGWDDMDAYNILVALRVVPETNPTKTDEDYNPHEFCVSDVGIRYIYHELSMINQRFGTHLDWRLYPGDNFVLVWRDELQQSIGDPNDPPVNRYYLDHRYKGLGWDSLAKHFELPCTPKPIILIDAEVFYHKYVYGDDSDPMSDDSD